MKLKRNEYFKLTKTDGFDWYTGNTINYREYLGETVVVPKDKTITLGRKRKYKLCTSDVIHACKKINNCFVGAELPSSVFVVSGKPVVKDKDKMGFTQLKVVEEITENLDDLFGWRYNEACSPVNPVKLKAPNVGEQQIKLLKEWASVWDNVWASVWVSFTDSVWASITDSVGASVWDSITDSVWDSITDSVWASVTDSVGASIRDSVWAYSGSLFPNIPKWKYAKHEKGVYPFQSVADLWRQGFVPSFDGETWRLHAGKKAQIVYEIKKEELSK